MDKQQLIEKAIQLAVENVRSGSGGPFGAIVVRRGQIVASGANQVTSTLDPTAHAEIVAIRAACQAIGSFELSDCEIYSSCEPCPMCLAAIYWARAARVYFGAKAEAAVQAGFADGFFKEQICLSYEKQQLPIEQLGHKDVLAPFQAWNAKKDKTLY